MDSKELMMRSLKKLLPHRETLLYPISCMIRDDDVYHASFLGLTENFLLIARMSGEYMICHDRIPLNIASVKIKKRLGYTIDISFEDHEPIRIQAPARMRKLDCQAENIVGFCAAIKGRSPRKDGYKLSTVSGTDIRMQYFNSYMYTVAGGVLLVYLILLCATWGDPRYPLEETLASIPVGVVLLSPLIILSILNRFFIGRIVCTLSEDGICTENEMISWDEIQSVNYIAELPARHNRRWCRLCVLREKQFGKEFTTEIQHFPYYGLRKIRQLRPNLKATFDKGVVYITLAAIGLSVLLVACRHLFG